MVSGSYGQSYLSQKDVRRLCFSIPKNNQVAEVNEVYTSEEKNNTIIKLGNLGDPQDYSITMVYDIQPL